MPGTEAPNRLAVFDIDGTLTATNAVDDECFRDAVAESLELDPRDIDWGDAPHVTDSSIAHWLWARHRSIAPESTHLEAFRARFVELLQAQLTSAPHRFRAIAGAAGLFSHLRSAGWSVALATGGWGVSAQLKLSAAGIWTSDLPLACADDALTREDIVRLACKRAQHHPKRGGADFERVVSVGDGVWDVRTASNLRLPFVGVATGAKAARLTAAGATTLLPDLQCWDEVLEALDTAAVPRVDVVGSPARPVVPQASTPNAGTRGRHP
jgi:phosphoglycolate phosphatase-like HAD superfamily hydrolase